FTTRIDTIYGATAVVLSAEHPLLERLLEGSSLKSDVERFIARVREARRRPAAPGTEEEKEGVHTGLFAINPFNGEQVP
ncbi:hypothetical protein WAJ75_23865, partial [Acinetobacter baumannii]